MCKLRISFFLALSALISFNPCMANYEAGLAALNKYDYKTVYKEWKTLAEKGNADVQATLAVMYHTGQGVKQNYKKAFYWYKKAAVQGLTAAQANLGVMYAKGTGTKKDYVQSYAWYSLAAEALPIEKVGSALWGIDYVWTQMTPKQIKKAKSLLKKYMKKYPVKPLNKK
jgi:hypothetical protein